MDALIDPREERVSMHEGSRAGHIETTAALL